MRLGIKNIDQLKKGKQQDNESWHNNCKYTHSIDEDDEGCQRWQFRLKIKEKFTVCICSIYLYVVMKMSDYNFDLPACLSSRNAN